MIIEGLHSTIKCTRDAVKKQQPTVSVQEGTKKARTQEKEAIIQELENTH